MPGKALLHEAEQLNQVSMRLDALAGKHPSLAKAILSISVTIRNAATLIGVLVATKMGDKANGKDIEQ